MKGPFNLHASPGPKSQLALSFLLFILCLGLYQVTVMVRHAENPQDKIVPSFTQMADGLKRSAFEADRDGEIRLLVDTWASLKRFLISLVLLVPAVLLGLYMGIFPYFELLFLRFTTFFDKIPALAILPILFIVFGLGEVSKVALILIGVFPTIALDAYLRAKDVPREQLTKGLTLGASHHEISLRIVLPQILPAVLNTIRLNFKAMILFLIAGESLAATVGLGYRIFVVRRYMAMDIIIPYVVWMSLLAMGADLIVRLIIKKRYPWAMVNK
jgi:NitT/TauT family transport system permease protein